MSSFVENVGASVVGTFICFLVGLAWAWGKRLDFEKIMGVAFSEKEVDKEGWYNYLMKFQDRFAMLSRLPNNHQNNQNNLNWEISDAIGALEIIRKSKSEMQGSLLSRIFYSSKIAELEQIEHVLISYLQQKKSRIQGTQI